MRKSFLTVLAFFLIFPLFPKTISAQTPSQPEIIGDLSGSMKGFAVSSGTKLGDIYQILVINIPSAQLFGLRTEVRKVDKNQARYFSSAKNYGGDTDLATAIKDVREKLQQAVLVTDGMQSQARYLGIKNELEKMADGGWGIWLFEVDLGFQGVYDTEMPVDLNTLQRSIQDCAQKRDPKAKVVPSKKNPERLYDYSGSRPLLMFVFSKDAGQGRLLAQKILLNVKADSRFSPQVVEISPMVYRGVEFAVPQPRDLTDYLRIDGFTTNSPTIRSDTADGKRIKELVMPILWRSEPPPLPQAVNEVPNYDAKQCSWLDGDLGVEPPRGDQDAQLVTGYVTIKLINEVSWLRSNFCWIPGVSCAEEKPDHLDISASSEFTSVQNAWWNELSTDTSWECPNKVFKLSELVNDVAKVATKRHQQVRHDRDLSFRLIVGPL